MKKEIMKSKCCNANVILVEGMSDFIGDKHPIICTCSFKCSKCKKACDIIYKKK